MTPAFLDLVRFFFFFSTFSLRACFYALCYFHFLFSLTSSAFTMWKRREVSWCRVVKSAFVLFLLSCNRFLYTLERIRGAVVALDMSFAALHGETMSRTLFLLPHPEAPFHTLFTLLLNVFLVFFLLSFFFYSIFYPFFLFSFFFRTSLVCFPRLLSIVFTCFFYFCRKKRGLMPPLLSEELLLWVCGIHCPWSSHCCNESKRVSSKLGIRLLFTFYMHWETKHVQSCSAAASMKVNTATRNHTYTSTHEWRWCLNLIPSQRKVGEYVWKGISTLVECESKKKNHVNYR